VSATAGPVRTGAGVAVLDAGRLLLVHRTVEPARGWWSVPGGLLDAGEDPRGGAVREVREETGLTVAVDAFLGAFIEPDPREPSVFLLFEGHVVAGTMRAADDADRVAFFAADELPPLAFASTYYAASRLSAVLDAGRRR
jgi:8-oxo-dGTP diphosphatase